MITGFFDWCSRNIEIIIWFNIILLTVAAVDQALQNNFYPLGLCAMLVAILCVLKK